MPYLTDILNTRIPDLREKRLSPVTVAVIDSGVDSTHELLRHKVVRAWGFQEEKDTVVFKELNPHANNDVNGHGTAVASIITRIAPNARILDYKVFSIYSSGFGKAIIAGLKAAVESNAKSINMSVVSISKYRDEIASLLELAYQKHKIVVASRRNPGSSIGDLGLPAELATCISVDNQTYDFNPYFVEHIDKQPIEFAAHGESVLVAQSGGGYYRLTGTSFAAPTVSGNVALLLGRYPDLELFEIKSILKYHSQRKSFLTTQSFNPLETSETIRSHEGEVGFGSYICPHCKELLRVHEAFQFVKCPKCKRTFPLNAGLDKSLFRDVIWRLDQYLPPKYVYHNALHTKEVISNAHVFSQHYPHLTSREKRCLLTAALLHDYGFTEQYERNEQIAASFVVNYLPPYGYSSSDISVIQNLIMVTMMPQKPKTLLEKIICDADLGHIGLKQFWEKSDLLRLERENIGKKLTDHEWLQEELEFLSSHHFHQQWLEKERKEARQKAVRQIKRILARMA